MDRDGCLRCRACGLSLGVINMDRKKDYYSIDVGTFGDFLKEEWLEPLGITSYSLAKSIGISTTAMGKILSGKNRMSDDTGWRLAHYFGVSKGYFVSIQAKFIEKALAKDFDKEAEKLPVFDWSKSKQKNEFAGL